MKIHYSITGKRTLLGLATLLGLCCAAPAPGLAGERHVTPVSIAQAAKGPALRGEVSIAPEGVTPLGEGPAPRGTFPRMAHDLDQLLLEAPSADTPVKVIVQTAGRVDARLPALERRFAFRARRVLSGIDAFAATLPARDVALLARAPSVRWISPDRTVIATGNLELASAPDRASTAREEEGMEDVNDFAHLAITTGASQVIASPEDPSGLNGGGIGIAQLDSGFYNPSCAFWTSTVPTHSRLVYWEDFTDEKLSPREMALGGDLYGHGTHVASVMAGDGCRSEPGELWAGITRGSSLMSLRVLNSQGRGDSSDVIAAIDRAIKHKEEYNIRVMNMSLGTTPGESYRTDPLCQAVERAVAAGIVVVAAAGNYGQNESGDIVYGGILSPAIDPMVITVGAVDTRGSNERSDDEIARFSSRGPTLGCNGDDLTTCDLLLKPDVVAPGVYIEGVVYPNNYLYTTYPQTHLEGTRSYFYLHGTSIAAPVVAGTVALMLQENPSMSPNLVKAILEYSAIPFADQGVLDQGAGQVNVAGAVEMARALRHDLDQLKSGDPMVRSGADLPVPETTIADETWAWSQLFFWEWRALSGDGPFRNMQDPWIDSSSFVWGGGLTYPEWEATAEAEGESFVWGGSFVWGDSFVWGGSLLWGGSVMDYEAYAEWSGLLAEDPLEDGGSSSGSSLLWGGSVITAETFSTPNSALVDGLELEWGRGP